MSRFVTPAKAGVHDHGHGELTGAVFMDASLAGMTGRE